MSHPRCPPQANRGLFVIIGYLLAFVAISQLQQLSNTNLQFVLQDLNIIEAYNDKIIIFINILMQKEM